MGHRELKQRCYLRYVEVYSPRPNFLATFAFVHPRDVSTVVDLGFESGTVYGSDGFRIERNGATTWRLLDGCLQSSNCQIEGEAATNLLSAFSDGSVLIQEFSDRRGVQWRLEWDLSRFREVLTDYRQASAERSLLK